MPIVKAIGFDLFGTLVLQERFSFDQCLDAPYSSLQCSGFPLEKDTFVPTYRQVNRRFMDQTMVDGRETHNRLWVAAALQALGYAVDPSDARVDEAVEADLSPLSEAVSSSLGHTTCLPASWVDIDWGWFRTSPILQRSNKSSPASELNNFLTSIIISGWLGFRKPHPAIFSELLRRLALASEEIVFVGDELQADIVGAQNAGMQTVWMTYRQQHERPSPLGQFLGMSEAAEGICPHHVVVNWTEFLATLT